MYPSLRIDQNKLSKIINETHKKFNVPFHCIKVIGSAHMGFSLVDKKKTGDVKFFDKSSDVDLAIINTDLFARLMTNTLIATEGFKNLTSFPHKKSGLNYPQYYRRNLQFGFIRPDTIGCTKDRNIFLNFFEELSDDMEINVSGAIYLNEVAFITKLEKQFNAFLQIKEVRKNWT